MSGPSRTYFRGFISPELYSEPDIAPPYDVRVIATDGLGELRRYLFEPMGTQPLDIIITSLLERTGLPGYFFHNNNTLVGGEDSNVPVGGFFGDTYINLDCFAGKPCYDVLTGILDSLHADLFQRIEVSGEYWQILRENDVESGTSIVYGRSASSASTNRTVSTTLFGSMRTQPWWPVGHLDSDIKPACKRLKIITDALYGEGLDNAGIDSDAAWVKSSASYLSSQKAYQVTAQGGYIRQTVSFEVAVRRRLKLQVRLRQYRPTASSASSAGTASITVSMYGSTYGGTGTRYLTRNDLGELYWATEQASLSVDLPAPAYTDTEDNCTVFEVELPLFSGAPRNFARADSITVRITRDSATVPLLIHSASLTMAEQILGYQDIFTINNGARDDADDVRSMFLPALTGFYGTPVEFMCGVPKTLLGEVVNLFDPVGLDYAKSCCLPRLYKRGVLNVPSGAEIPFVLRDSQGINYLIRSFDWNVLASEFDVEMLSRPAASVTVTGQDVSELAGSGGTVSPGSGSSGGGGGGATTVSYSPSYQPTNPKEYEVLGTLSINGAYYQICAPKSVFNIVGNKVVLDPIDFPDGVEIQTGKLFVQKIDTAEIASEEAEWCLVDGDGYVVAKINADGIITTSVSADRVAAPKYTTPVPLGFDMIEDAAPAITICDSEGFVLDRLQAGRGFYGSVKNKLVKLKGVAALSWIDDDFAVIDNGSLKSVYSKLHTWCLDQGLALDFATDVQTGVALTTLLAWEREGFRYVMHPDHEGWWTGEGGYVHDLSKVKASLVDTIRFFRVNGLCSDAKILVWPGSSNEVPANIPVVSKYCDCAISVRQGGNPGIVNDRYQLQRIKIDGISSSRTKSFIKDSIRDSLANGEWVILYTHMYEVDPADTVDNTSNTFGNICDIVSYANGLVPLRSSEEIWRDRKLMYDF